MSNELNKEDMDGMLRQVITILNGLSNAQVNKANSIVRRILAKVSYERHDQWLCNIRNKRCPLLIKTKYCLAKSCQYRVERSN